jgi:hypothetical protein
MPPAELGKLIAAALVGTFLGILLAYGFVGPLASLLEQKLHESTKMFQCMKVTLLASLNGYAPQVAVEFGRKVLYSTERPGFKRARGRSQESQGKRAASPARPPRAAVILPQRTTDWRRGFGKQCFSPPERAVKGEQGWGVGCMSDDSQQPIIVKRIKKGGGGHHGGAWKIAYADFVTAMMAFFLLMWLLGSTAKGDLRASPNTFPRRSRWPAGRLGLGRCASSVIKGGGTDLTRKTGQVKQGEVKARRRPSTCRR